MSWLVLLVVVGAAGVVGYGLLTRPAQAPASAGPAAPQTVAVTKTDLANTTTINGTLGYATATPFTGRKAGTITWLPSAGTVVDQGQKLYTVDAKPVTLFFGDTPLYRKVDTEGMAGPDVKEIAANLRALGYTGVGNGEKFTSGTAAAVKRWQKSIGVDETGAIDVGDLAVLPAKVRVESVRAQLGGPAAAELLALTGTGRAVTAQVDTAQIDLVKQGTKVTLQLPDGKQTAGTVDAVGAARGGSQAGAPPGDSTQPPKVAVTIAIDDQNAAGQLDSGPVQVRLAAETKQGVLAVPVTALIALQEGGYAVQVVTGTTTTTVAVHTGMFASGLVEVSGPGVREGMRVVTTS
ncbi:peptidoglycan-binding protein [Solihabitans fulvus]|uniref:peptidoglycan-binding protein n=1 Tax=Solihabitans fulvus TaxID=1892852 RepID=UPI001CB76368|nr:peptidoglycan-binding domain-containing protein [Solihabitans fulvus]